MANTRRLAARTVETIKTPGMHADGEGLYLVVTETGSKRWTFIYQHAGKRRELGLGSLSKLGLAGAREEAARWRQVVGRGEDPKAVRDQEQSERAEPEQNQTFGPFADALVDRLAPEFRNSKHIAQWRMTFRVYCAKLRAKRLDQIDTQDVLSVLTPLWQEKPETASRVRGRIERALDAAKAEGLREGENPARWRGHLQTILPKRQKLTRGHHAAMPYRDVPAFMSKLSQAETTGAKALQLLILCANRAGEVAGARWDEVDLDEAVWTVDAKRMKAGRPHRIPLPAAATAVLRQMAEVRTGEYVFAGSKPKKPISPATLTKALKAAGGSAFTVHGFRSSFRDFIHEETSFPDTLAEAALAHVVGDATERAYRRGDALKRRLELMTASANYCLGGSRATKVVSMKPKRMEA